MISQDRNLIRLFGAMPRIRTPPSTVTCIVLTDWTNMANEKLTLRNSSDYYLMNLYWLHFHLNILLLYNSYFILLLTLLFIHHYLDNWYLIRSSLIFWSIIYYLSNGNQILMWYGFLHQIYYLIKKALIKFIRLCFVR